MSTKKKMRCPQNPQVEKCATQTALREFGVLWVMVELAYAGEERTRRAYSRDQETLIHRHTENCVEGDEVYRHQEGSPGKGGGAWPPTIFFARTRSRQSANWGPIMSPQ